MLIWGQMGITQVPVWTQELMAISPRFGFRLDSWPAGDAQNIQCQGGFSDGWKGVSSFRSMGSYVDCQLAVAKSIIVSDGVAVSGALGVNYHRWNGADGLTRFRPLAILQFHLDQTEYSEVEGRVSLSPMGPQPIWQTRNDVLAQIGWERSHLNHSFRADVWWQAGGFAMRGQVWWVPGLVLAVGSIAGAMASVRFAIKVSQNTVKWLVLVMVTATCAGAAFL